MAHRPSELIQNRLFILRVNIAIKITLFMIIRLESAYKYQYKP